MSAHHHSQVVPPEPVSGLGTTWVGRGFPYWRRRALWSLLYFLLFAVGASGSAGFIIAFLSSHNPVPVRVILIVISGCVIFGAAFFTFRSIRKQERSNEPRPRMGPLARNLVFSGSALRMIANTLIGALMIICCFYVTAGGGLVIFLLSLRRVLPDEARARRRLQILQTHPEPTSRHRPTGKPHPSQTTKRQP
jgi:hypothetical protein